MTWRARTRPVPLTLLILLAVIAFTALTYRTAHAKSDAVETITAYLKNKNVRMKEGKLKKVVWSVYRESRQRNLDYRLTLAVIEAESNFQQDAVSDKGARGLMQIKPSLAKYISKDAGVKYDSDRCLHEPEKNIKLGVYHLARLVGDFKNLPTALHAYNAGETRVKARISRKEPKTTYTRQVIREYERNLRVLPDANEPVAEVTFSPNTSKGSGWQAMSSAGWMCSPRKHHLEEERVTVEAEMPQGKMTVPQLGERPGNVSAAYRRQDVLRSPLPEYKRAFQKGGAQGLIDHPRMPQSSPNEAPSEVKEKALTRSVTYAPHGQMEAPEPLRLEKVSATPSAVRKTWFEEGLETRHEYILRT